MTGISEEFIDLRAATVPSKWVSDLIVHLEENKSISFALIVNKLKRVDGVDSVRARQLLDIATSRELSLEQKVLLFLQYAIAVVDSDKLFHAICSAGHRDLTFLVSYLQNKPVPRPAERRDIPCSKRSHTRYHFLKACMDNNVFRDARSCLREFQDHLIAELNPVPDESKKAVLADLVVIMIHRVQLCGESEVDNRRQILHSLRDVNSGCLDRSALELVFYSKMAVTEAKDGNRREAEDFLRQTMIISDRHVASFATILALNDVIYARQELLFKGGGRRSRRAMLAEATDDRVLMSQIVNSEGLSETAVKQWRRIVLLFKVMTYLNISHEFEVGNISHVSENDVEVASTFLTEVKAISQGIEIRREMTLKLCEGRALERQDLQCALASVKMAVDMTNDGCFRATERSNINSYYDRLRRRCMDGPFVNIHQRPSVHR